MGSTESILRGTISAKASTVEFNVVPESTGTSAAIYNPSYNLQLHVTLAVVIDSRYENLFSLNQSAEFDQNQAQAAAYDAVSGGGGVPILHARRNGYC